MRIPIFIILFLIYWNSAIAAPADDILGTWQLVEVEVTSLADSNPRGIPAFKEHYSNDGRLYFIEPTAVLNSSTQWVAYKIRDNKRTVQLDNGSKYFATLNFEGPDNLLVTQQAGDQWRYKRIEGENSTDRIVEPVSVEVLNLANSEKKKSIAYDTSDYSELSIRERLIGVWEVIAHENVPRREAPPYGYLNDIWIFDGTEMTLIVRAQSGNEHTPKQSYNLKNNIIEVMRGNTKTLSIASSFNAWGHLVLDMGGHKISLKLIQKTVSDAPELPPLKIVLLSLEGEQ